MSIHTSTKTCTEIECCNCGICFIVSERYYDNLVETKKNFYCPNGHSQAFVKSTSETLKEQINQKDQEIIKLTRDLALANKKTKKKH